MSHPPTQPDNPGGGDNTGPGRRFTATDPDPMPTPDFPGDPYTRPKATSPDSAPTPDGPAPQPTPDAERELVAA